MHQLPDLPFYDATGPLAIAHRGGDAAGAEKENSMAAFQSAVAAGFHYIETDVITSSDGIAHAVHGAKNRREQQRSNLPVRSWLESLRADHIRQHVRIGGEPIPTLEEALLSFPGVHFFIDPKTWRSVEPLAAIIRKHRLHSRVSVGAFHFGRTQAVVDLAGGAEQLCATIGTLGSLALLGGRMPLQMARGYISRSSATQFALPFDRVTPAMVTRAHALGLRVLLWTPNTEADILRAFRTGADGVMSDRTQLVQEAANRFASV